MRKEATSNLIKLIFVFWCGGLILHKISITQLLFMVSRYAASHWSDILRYHGQ